MLLNLIQRYWIFLTLFILTIITILSLLPLEELPPIPSNDKVHHLIAYAILMFPIALKRPKYAQAIALILIGWSGAIELLQPYVNRYGEWQDLLANITGMGLGWLLANFSLRLFSTN